MPTPATTISFRSYDVGAGHFYIRHRNFLGELSRIIVNSPELDRFDSSFFIEDGLADVKSISIRASNPNFPDFYLRHSSFRIRLNKRPDSGPARQQLDLDATFQLHISDAPADWLAEETMPVIIQSYNYPDYYIHRRDLELWLDKYQDTPDARERSFFPVAGFA